MRFIFSLLLLQFYHSIAHSQNSTGKFNSDSLTAMIERLPEYKEEKKVFDSLARYCGLCTYSVGVTTVSNSDIMTGTINEQLESQHRLAYIIKYDMKKNKIISIEKSGKTTPFPH